jgi:hypothetical protein
MKSILVGVPLLGLLVASYAACGGGIPTRTTQYPIIADVYVDMAGQTTGAALTTTNAAAGTHGIIGSWLYVPTDGRMTVAAHRNNLPAPVKVGVITYAVDNASKAIAYNNSFNLDDAYFSIPSGHRVVTVSGFWTPGPPATGNSDGYFDCVNIAGIETGRGCVLQLNTGGTIGGGAGYRVRLETNPGGTTTHSTVQINLTQGTTYWFTMQANYTTGIASLEIYDTVTWAKIGLTATASQQTGEDVYLIMFGNIEQGTAPGFYTYWENLIVDYTNGVFPLGPL